MQLHRSNRAEALVDTLARIVAEPPHDPLAQECIVVQGPGMERWLSLELASRLGVFAHAAFPFPRAFLQQALGAVVGEAPDAGEAWEPESLTFALADRLPARLDDPRFAPIRTYLQGDDGDEKAFALARRIAETFDHYAVYRPEMVLAWERGDDAATERWAGVESAWQSVLWRDLVARQGGDHVAARVGRLIEALERGEAGADGLPTRVSLFGLSTLPPLFVSAFAALASRVALHAFVLSPSSEYWGFVRSEREQARVRRRAGAEGASEADLHLAVGHPLLASFGRVGREFQEVLEERVDYHESDVDLYADPADAEGTAPSPTLLHALQSDMLRLRDRGASDPGLPRWPLAPDDRSVSVHACHGPMREAQVLRDQLLDLFARDPDLEPHDVVVMAPDAARYAPFVEAAFASDADGGVGIPVRVADRGARATFPVIEAWSHVLEVLGGRLAAGDVLDLLAADCIRARFGITSDDEALLRAWVDASGVRWGIDADHRVREGQPDAVANTWRFGLDRLFAGMAIDDAPGRLFGDVAPQPGVEGAETEALGRLAELTTLLFDAHARARGRRSVADWTKLLLGILDDFIAVEGEAVHERQIVADAVEGLRRAAERAGHRGPIGLATVREMLESWLARAPAQGGFLTGAVTVCEMLPMRSIPFRVVCVLGMNDRAFPRVRRRPGFDLIGLRRRVGDRSSRDDDRQLFLEALLSARDHLIVTYEGSGIRDNEPLPPSVVVDELLDHVARAFRPADADGAGATAASPGEDEPGAWARDRLVVRHPLQPWSPRYFADADPAARLFSYSRAWGQATAGLAGPGAPPRPFVAAPLAMDDDATGEVPLEALQAFFRHPARFLLSRVLDVTLEPVEERRPDREPLDLVGLEAYAVGDELLEVALAGRDPADTYRRIAARGILPLGEAGRAAHAAIVAEVGGLAERVRDARAGPRRPDCEVRLALPDEGVRLVGRLDDLYPGGLVAHRYAKLGQHRELEIWIAHLALCAAAPAGVPKRTHLVGRPDDGGRRHVRFESVEDPLARLAELVAVYRLGRSRAIPFFPRTSRKYATLVARAPADDDIDRQAILSAYDAFAESRSGRAEAADPYVRQLFADVDPLAESFAPAGVEAGVAGFRALARRVFLPLLASRSGVS